MHIFCSWLHAAATVCLLHPRLADAAAGADGARGTVHPSVVVSVARSQTAPAAGQHAQSRRLLLAPAPARPLSGSRCSWLRPGLPSPELGCLAEGGSLRVGCLLRSASPRSHGAPFSGNPCPRRPTPLLSAVGGWCCLWRWSWWVLLFLTLPLLCSSDTFLSLGNLFHLMDSINVMSSSFPITGR